jgi:hypothetical protein
MALPPRVAASWAAQLARAIAAVTRLNALHASHGRAAHQKPSHHRWFSYTCWGASIPPAAPPFPPRCSARGQRY